MEHLRLDHQSAPLIGEGLTQEIYHYIYVRGRCSFIELFPIFARKEGFLSALENLVAQKKVFTDLKAIWAREKQITSMKRHCLNPKNQKISVSTY